MTKKFGIKLGLLLIASTFLSGSMRYYYPENRLDKNPPKYSTSSQAPQDFENYELICYNNGDQYSFDFKKQGEDLYLADMTAKDSLGEPNLPYFGEHLEVLVEDTSSRCWFGYRVEVFDKKFNRSFVHQEILADMCYGTETSRSFIVKDSSRDYMDCVVARKPVKEPNVRPSPFE